MLFPFHFLMAILLFTSCSGGGGSSSSPGPTYEVSGTVTYDFVPITSSGLNYSGTTKKPIRNTRMEARQSGSNQVLATSLTDLSGRFSLSVPQNSGSIYVAVVSQMLGPDIRIEDNTNGDALYLAASGPFDLTGDTTLAPLNAPSGWTGTNSSGSYQGLRVSAPFAILDSVYTAYQKFLNARPNLSFPPLKINWSPNNIAVPGDITLGQIGTSHFDGSELYILGKADADSDEFDRHIIVHEWGHFIEAKLSRSDSLGGDHGLGEIINMSLAFGEGWGNAISGIVLEPDITYRDSYGPRQQAIAVNFSLENGSDVRPGWFSEASVQQILFDIYDNNPDGADNINVGLGPIIDVMLGPQKNTPSLTSIFSFISGLKNLNPEINGSIDTLVSSKSIGPIQDSFGFGETNDGGEPSALPLYNSLPLNNSVVSVSLVGKGLRMNQAHNHRYFEFTATSGRTNISWNSSDTFLYGVFANGTIIRSEGHESDGSPLSGSFELTTVPNQKYIFLVTTDPDYVQSNAPITFSLSAQAR